jgi:hypothetical protein
MLSANLRDRQVMGGFIGDLKVSAFIQKVKNVIPMQPYSLSTVDIRSYSRSMILSVRDIRINRSWNPGAALVIVHVFEHLAIPFCCGEAAKKSV